MVKEKVSKHRRRNKKGRWRNIQRYSRKAKPKRSRNIKPSRIRFTHHRDDEGRFAYKR